MSYDIRFAVKVADVTPETFAVIGAPDYDSPTYNLREIFETSMDWDYHQGQWYPITEVLPKIQRGITELTLFPDKYRKMEPENGFGTITSAISCLESIVNYFKPGSCDGLAGSWNADVPINCIYMSW